MATLRDEAVISGEEMKPFLLSSGTAAGTNQRFGDKEGPKSPTLRKTEPGDDIS